MRRQAHVDFRREARRTLRGSPATATTSYYPHHRTGLHPWVARTVPRQLIGRHHAYGWAIHSLVVEGGPWCVPLLLPFTRQIHSIHPWECGSTSGRPAGGTMSSRFSFSQSLVIGVGQIPVWGFRATSPGPTPYWYTRQIAHI